MKRWKWTFLLVLLAVGRPALAGDVLSADEAALLASNMLDEQCSQAVADDPERRADALSTVAPAFGRVAESYRHNGQAFLLYWRGVLASCLSQDDEAASDLTEFVQAMDGRSEYGDQLRDARFRLRRLGVKVAKPDSPRALPGIVLGAIGGGLTGAGAAVHGSTFSQAQPQADGQFAGTTDEFRSLQAGNRVGFGMVLGGAALATAGLIGALVSSTRRGGTALRVVPMVAPHPDGGAVVGIGGRL